MTHYPHPTPQKQTPLWAWITMGALTLIIIVQGILLTLTILTYPTTTNQAQTTTQPQEAQGIKLGAATDGTATLFYTDPQGKEQEIQFQDKIEVTAQFKGEESEVVSASVVNETLGTGKPICAFVTPDGYTSIPMDDPNISSTGYFCAAVISKK